MKAPLLSYFGEPLIAKQLKDAIKKDTNRILLKGLEGSAFAIAAASTIRQSTKPHLLILRDKEEACYFLNDIESLLKNEVFFYPASYRRPYQFQETDNANLLLRAEVLTKLNNKRNPIIITYPKALAEKVISRKELKKQTISVRKGEKININTIENLLNTFNFSYVDFVIEAGQFSIRGGILDVFSYANEHPYRIEFLDDMIESIRTFDVNNQLSISLEEKISIVPNTEAKKTTNKHVSFLEYLPKNSVIWIKDIEHARGILDISFEKADHFFNKLPRKNKNYTPELLYTNGKTFCNNLSEHILIGLSNHDTFNYNNTLTGDCKPLLAFNKQFELLKKNLIQQQERGFRNIILCSSKEQEERFKAIFQNSDIKIKYTCVLFSLHEGFIDSENKIAVYTDHQIFNRHHRFKPKTRFSKRKSITLKQLTSLQLGDYVTHIDHGIGQFSGLHSVENNGKKQELIKLTYKEGDILYISIHTLHKISKYGSEEGLKPKLNQLGSPSWKKSKEKTKKRVKEIAFNLINLYAKRKKQLGFAFKPDTYLQHELEASFMFEDTPDQITATQAIKKDMESETPMDRLICGDVGFGKTELAIRAAFKAVTDSKQVAVLVPTTILALQHFKTFEKRLQELPCQVDYINRFKSNKEQSESLKRLKNGEIDILIGTHRIVSKDIKFKDLGLLIVDEEQKFGVNVKDKLKSLKSSVDTLTLSATPIPRTLQFSLMGARDLSIINTPPPNRQSIETKIIRFKKEIIRDAISYEMSRNGQIFFIHNRIENIKEVAALLKNLCPDAKIKIGHGQMEGKKMENLMLSFMNGDFDVLVSTTIIENGVDIPNANTIIINNAQNFGLSDLHQMRGRVGRSNRKAFCYLISLPIHQLSNDSRKRLNALEQFSSLGSGFNIAMRDLDIRGAGDLLGADQSGFINEIGFEMYQKILDEAINELKEEKFKDLFGQQEDHSYVKDCQLETDLEILIPNSYVSNIEERLSLYKIINNLKKEENITILEKNLIDRFGEIPDSVSALFNALRLRWKGRIIGFERILLNNNNMQAYFTRKSNTKYFESMSFNKVLNYLKRNPENCEMKEKNNKLSLKINNITSVEDAINACKDILSN